jgi:hypothetical protein
MQHYALIPFCSAPPFEKGRTPLLSATPWITDSITVQNIVIIVAASPARGALRPAPDLQGINTKQQPGIGDATCGHRCCDQRPPHLLPASTAIATCDHRRCYRRPQLWLHTTTTVATYDHRCCYRRPMPLRPGATAIATRGHHCYIRLPPMLPAVTAVAPGSCQCCY